MSKKLIIRDAVDNERLAGLGLEPIGIIYLSWKVLCDNGEWAEPPYWGLLKEASGIEGAVQGLRERGHVFDVEDLRVAAPCKCQEEPAHEPATGTTHREDYEQEHHCQRPMSQDSDS